MKVKCCCCNIDHSLVRIASSWDRTLDMSPQEKKKDKDRRKYKVVAAVWGAKCIQFLADLAVLH